MGSSAGDRANKKNWGYRKGCAILSTVDIRLDASRYWPGRIPTTLRARSAHRLDQPLLVDFITESNRRRISEFYIARRSQQVEFIIS